MLAAAAGLTLLAFGRHTLLFPWLLVRAPGLGLFRYPAKFFLLASLLFLTAGGLGLNAAGPWLQGLVRPRSAVLFIALLYALALALTLSLAARSAAEIKAMSPHPGVSLLRVKQDLGRLALFAFLLPGLGYLFIVRQAGRGAVPFMIIGIAALDLASTLPAKPLNPARDFFRESLLAADLRPEGDGRLLVDDQIFYRLSVGPRTSLKPNWAILDGLEYGLGKTAILPRFLSDLNDQKVFSDHAAGLLRILAVKHILSSLQPPLPWAEKLIERGLARPGRSPLVGPVERSLGKLLRGVLLREVPARENPRARRPGRQIHPCADGGDGDRRARRVRGEGRWPGRLGQRRIRELGVRRRRQARQARHRRGQILEALGPAVTLQLVPEEAELDGQDRQGAAAPGADGGPRLDGHHEPVRAGRTGDGPGAHLGAVRAHTPRGVVSLTGRSGRPGEPGSSLAQASFANELTAFSARTGPGYTRRALAA
jgi:hypothetical protein